MRDFLPIGMVVGYVVMAFAATMVIPCAVDFFSGEPNWTGFALSGGITLLAGILLVATNKTSLSRLSLRQVFLLTNLLWIFISLLGALPFIFAEQPLDFTSAAFEAMSGLTTTGATVLSGLEEISPGLLIWRSLLQFFGGGGIVLMAMLILPTLSVGGMQLFHTEFSNLSGKAHPKTVHHAAIILGIYQSLTLVAALCYWLAGMSGLDAITHAMTTLATGGFSTHDASLGYYSDPLIHWLAILFMILGALPFVLYFRSLRGVVRPTLRHDARALARDAQVRAMMAVILALTCLLYAERLLRGDHSLFEALRMSLFTIVSILTTTGYTITDYGSWGGFTLVLILLLTLLGGGCAGSTSGGIKIFRLQILVALAIRQVQLRVRPSAILTLQYNRQTLNDELAMAIMAYFCLYILTFVTLALGVSATGLDMTTAISAAAAMVSNVGPGLGEIVGPSGNYGTLPDAAKWMLIVGMLLGRLELLTVFVLAMVGFWRD